MLKFKGIAAAALATAMMCGSAIAADKIGIAQFGKHPQLDRVVETFKEELAAQGLKDIEFVESQVNFDTNLIPQMVTKLQSASPKLILSITTPVSQGTKQLLAGTNIPVVFAAVTDPVAAKLVPAWDKADATMTGASDLQDLDAVLAFSKKLLPGAKRVGFPYNPGEANDVATLDLIKGIAPKHGLEIVEVGIDSVNDIPVRITSLKGMKGASAPGSSLETPSTSSTRLDCRRSMTGWVSGSPKRQLNSMTFGLPALSIINPA